MISRVRLSDEISEMGISNVMSEIGILVVMCKIRYFDTPYEIRHHIVFNICQDCYIMGFI